MTESLLARKLAAKLRRLYWKTFLRFSDTVTVPTKQGLFTVACADHVIGKDLYCSREFELDLIIEATTALEQAGHLSGDGQGTLIDIGANIGPIAIAMLQLGLLKGDRDRARSTELRVVTKKRRPESAERPSDLPPVRRVLRLGQPGVRAVSNQFGDHRVRTGTADEEQGNQHGEASREVIQVPSEPLDELLAELPSDFTDDIRLIWIDVQGHEGQAFLGAQEVLSRGVPVVAEIWPYGVRRAGVTAEEFCQLAEDLWTEAWIERNGRFERSPVAELAQLFRVPDPKGRYFENVMFTGVAAAAQRGDDRQVA